ncbi:metal-dependent hydrolase [Candidatus Pacearchaeota archaeon]|nr:metal-dependent hydrolase [Candidatus Pacearchaeota archaeon]
MPHAITHILVPLLLVSVFRDFYIKKRSKKDFSLHYVLIAGLAGITPDIDIIIRQLQGYTHILLIPIIFLFLFFIFRKADIKAKICNIGRHKLKLSLIFLMFSIGTFIHIFLDSMIWAPSQIFSPFFSFEFGLNIVKNLSLVNQDNLMAILDGSFFIIWLAYLELKHKISDFI